MSQLQITFITASELCSIDNTKPDDCTNPFLKIEFSAEIVRGLSASYLRSINKII